MPSKTLFKIRSYFIKTHSLFPRSIFSPFPQSQQPAALVGGFPSKPHQRIPLKSSLLPPSPLKNSTSFVFPHFSSARVDFIEPTSGPQRFCRSLTGAKSAPGRRTWTYILYSLERERESSRLRTRNAHVSLRTRGLSRWVSGQGV